MSGSAPQKRRSRTDASTTEWQIKRARDQIAEFFAANPDLLEIEDLGLRADMIEGETEAVELLRRVALAARQLGRSLEWMRAYEQELASQRRRRETVVNRIRSGLLAAMQEAGLRRLPDEIVPAPVYIGNGTEQIVGPSSQDGLKAMPPEFVIVEVNYKLDRSAVAAALDEGRDVPGCHRSNGSPYLVIR